MVRNTQKELQMRFQGTPKEPRLLGPRLSNKAGQGLLGCIGIWFRLSGCPPSCAYQERLGVLTGYPIYVCNT